MTFLNISIHIQKECEREGGGERKRSGSPATKRHGSFLSRVTMEARKRVLKVGRVKTESGKKTRTDYMDRVEEREIKPFSPARSFKTKERPVRIIEK